MKQLIQAIDGWADLTAAELLAVLSETVAVQDATAWTFAAIGRRLGAPTRVTVNRTMLAITSGQVTLPAPYDAMVADIDSARIALSTSGMTLHEDETQGLIDVLATAGGWPDELRDAVKALGVTHPTRWATLGGEGDLPTEADVQAGLAVIAAEQSLSAIIVRANEAIAAASAAYDAGNDATAVTTAAEAAWAGQ